MSRAHAKFDKLLFRREIVRRRLGEPDYLIRIGEKRTAELMKLHEKLNSSIGALAKTIFKR